MDAAPPKPAPLRLLNGVGRALRRVGLPLVPLDPVALAAAASRNTGLYDFGDTTFHEPFELLLESLEHEAHLTLLGRLIVRRDLVRTLENRLRLVHAWKTHPEILTGRIERPVFIMGLPRTGTSILHELLAQDPTNRVPMTWEVMHPWPPPERATFTTDRRIAKVDQHFSGIDRLLPDFKSIHPMGATLPQECVALTAHDFATMIHHTTHDVPSYQRWLETANLRWVYASHRRQLQYLQWKCPAERWALKSPGHLWALDALLAEYPDARIVQTHRDPLKVIASLANLASILRSLASDRIDPLAIGADWTARLARGLEHTMTVRSRGLPPTAQVFDLQFVEFMRDEIAMVRRIYTFFGLELTAEAERRMRAFLQANPADKHGKHKYTLTQAGLDETTERRRYATYQERFSIPQEVVN